MKRGNERGNVFTVLIGGVAMAGALGYMMYQTMSGPIAGMVRITKSTAAEARMMALSRAVLTDAVTQDTATSGDCDADGAIEPRAWTAPASAGGAPAGGGLLPSAIASPVTDAWGTTYGYCVWDTGSDSDPAGCGASANRLEGSPAPSAEAEAGLQTVIALVSAGPDRRFSTTCKTYTAATGDASNDLVSTSGDDIVERHSYAEAAISVGELWTIKTGTPTTAVIAKDVSVPMGAMSARALTATGGVTASGGIRLGTQVQAATCNAGNAGLTRYNNGGISVVQAHATGGEQNGNTSQVRLTFEKTPAPGNAVVVAVWQDGTSLANTAITDNQGGASGSYTEAVATTDSKGYIFTRTNIPAVNGAFTVTIAMPGSASQMLWTIMEVSGLAAAATADQTGTGSSAAAAVSTAVTASGATTQASEIVFGIGIVDGAADGSEAITAASGWTTDFSAPSWRGTSVSVVHQVLTATATPSHTWTHPAQGAAGGKAALVTLKGAVAAASAAGLEYCDGTAWTAAGGGGVGSAVDTIDELTDGATNYATLYNMGLGSGALSAVTIGENNVAAGQAALSSVTSGVANTAVGRNTMAGLVNGNFNTAAGYEAAKAMTGGAGNLAIGASTMVMGDGDNNVAVGSYAMYNLGAWTWSNVAFGAFTMGNAGVGANTAFGHQALMQQGGDTVGNTGFGFRALMSNVSGDYNTAFGADALVTNTASYNTAFGYQALMNNRAGESNTAAGYQALLVSTAANANTAAGYRALAANTTGSGNVAIGNETLKANTTGSGNTVVGRNSMVSNTTGSGNTLIGGSAMNTATTASGNAASLPWAALQSLTTGRANTSFDASFWNLTTGNYNTGIGGVLSENATGSGNTAIGRALDGDGSVSMNTIIGGFGSMDSNAGGSYNAALSNHTMIASLTVSNATVAGASSMPDSLASGNTAGGNGALNALTTGAGNTALGRSASNNLTTGSGNAVMGQVSMYNNVTGSGNTVAGRAAGRQTAFGDYNTHLGWGAGFDADGSYNTVTGYSTLYNADGASGVALAGYQASETSDNRTANRTGAGYRALQAATTGTGNTALGSTAMTALTTGSYNTAVGKDALNDITIESYNTAMGNASMALTVAATSTGAAPICATVGTAAGGTGDVTPSLPAHEAGDIFLLFVESANQVATAPAGWAEVANSPQGTGAAGGASSTRLTVFWRRATASETNPTVTDTGDHTYAQILLCSAASSAGNPWDVTAGNTAASDTAVTFPSVTTTVANAAIVMAVSNASTGQSSIPTNAGLTSISEWHDGNTASGNGGAMAISVGTKDVAGATGAGAATLTGAAEQARIVIAIKPDTASGTGAAYNTAVGMNALGANGFNGGYNTAVGNDALLNVTKGGYNTAVGYNAGPASTTPTIANTIAIGKDASTTVSDTIRIGDTAITAISGQVAWTATSDRRYKKDIRDSDLGLDFIMRLRPVSYHMKNGNGRLDYGFIAQEVGDALQGRDANMVTQQHDEMKTWTLRHDDLISPLVKAVQERQQRIERQQQDIDALRAMIEAEETKKAQSPPDGTRTRQ